MSTDTNTENLIARLAAEPAAPAWRPGRSLALALALGGAGTLAMFLIGWGPRPGFPAALADPVMLAKTLLPLALALLAVPAALRSAQPGVEPGAMRRLPWAVPIVAMAMVGAALVWPDGDRLAQFLGYSIHVCLPSIPALSLPLLAGALVVLRRGAPVRPGRSGALAGLVAGGFGAAVYSTFCTEDSPLFYVPWYGTGILLAAGIGALAGRRWLRW